MQNIFRFSRLAAFVFIAGLFITSCNKSGDTSVTPSSSGTLATSQYIVTAVDSSGTDSVGVLLNPHDCPHGAHRDSVAQSGLLASITTYLTTNYAGYTFKKAYKLSDSTKVLGYAVIVLYNGKTIALGFDATGTFSSVLEQRDLRDLGDGPGFHEGGHFGDRDGMHRDTLAQANLLPSIKSYFVTTYPTDTFSRAYTEHNGDITVITKNNGVFVTEFSSTGAFIKRITLPMPPLRPTIATISAATGLPITVQTYLTAKYPNYVFETAYAATQSGILVGYLVVIDANNTKYGLLFDASGNFVGGKVIH